MPVKKGLITGRSAYSDGGLPLSIGSSVGGARHLMSRRASKHKQQNMFEQLPYVYLDSNADSGIAFNDFVNGFDIDYKGFCDTSFNYYVNLWFTPNYSRNSPFVLSIPDIGEVINNLSVNDFASNGTIIFQQTDQGFLVSNDLNNITVSLFTIAFANKDKTHPSIHNLSIINNVLKNYVGKTYKATLTSANTAVLKITGEEPIQLVKRLVSND